MISARLFFLGVLLAALHAEAAEAPMTGRPGVRLETSAAALVVDLGGGSIGQFRFADNDLNPLTWSAPKPGDLAAQPFGHFLCLDRWGPPSDAEAARGMPYHGEASRVQWTLSTPPEVQGDAVQAQMTATLPIAGLSVRRTIRLAKAGAIFKVREEVTNQNPLGRIFNMVQHATIAPPFLDGTTIVDCNGGRGFAQGGSLTTPENPSANWPIALRKDGAQTDLRHLTTNPNPNVVSFAIPADYGWITAATPGKRLLLGYFWRTSDYPWVSVWRDVRDGRPAARGLEFGTTGLHQPFPILVKKSRIWDHPLFEYLDAGQTVSKQFIGFLVKIPADFAGTESVKLDGDRLIVSERRTGSERRVFTVPGISGLEWNSP